MKNDEIKSLTNGELIEKLKIELKLYGRKKINHRISPLNNTALITFSRKKIAQIKTEIAQRNINK
ncbi:MAG: 50S ribosomal protein L29 [Bacteroidales bacterium OttesenSCG-928-I14]|jgi:large subunit ribosomal protein L29|nr:50S ribosomal protein L29 [Bacteroidales bacterium OttesenSCG-928-I14]